MFVQYILEYKAGNVCRESIFITKLLCVSLRKKIGGKGPTLLEVIVVLVLIYES